MADNGVYTKNADIQARAGVDANTTAKAVAATDVYVLDVEAFVNVKTQRNWSDDFAGLDVDVKSLLTEAGACLCAMNVIQQDPDAIGRSAAALMLNVLSDRANKAIKVLSEQDSKDFMDGV